jgi:HSF-type DNA-binding
MNCTLLEQEGLSNLVEAATALATFSLCSRAPVPAISPDQTKNTYGGPSVTTFNNTQSIPLQGHPVSDETRVMEANLIPSAEANKETFPQRLLAILNDKDVSSDVISWLPNGRSFIIARPDIFMESILPKYIAPDSNRSSPVTSTTISTKYPSFTRKLNRWYV